MRAATSDDIRSICRDPDGDLFMCEDCDRSDEKYYFVEEDEVAEFEKLLKAGHTSRYAYFYRSGEYPPGEHPYYREEDDDELVRPL
jgi:hypothetical protein